MSSIMCIHMFIDEILFFINVSWYKYVYIIMYLIYVYNVYNKRGNTNEKMVLSFDSFE